MKERSIYAKLWCAVLAVVLFAVVLALVAFLVLVTPQDPDSKTNQTISSNLIKYHQEHGDENIKVWEIHRYNSWQNSNAIKFLDKVVAVPHPPVVKNAASATAVAPLVSSNAPRPFFPTTKQKS
jgi:hypothetical protein